MLNHRQVTSQILSRETSDVKNTASVKTVKTNAYREKLALIIVTNKNNKELHFITMDLFA